MESKNDEFLKGLIKKGENIFFNPQPLYPYSSLINGCTVKSSNDNSQIMYAVGTNTWRGFHKTDKYGIGSKEIFTSYFNTNKESIINRLKTINTMQELDEFEDKICVQLIENLNGHIKENMLSSYNKIRKPVDLYIEHIVSMAEEVSADDRYKLAQLLFLPLDSQIFASEYIFLANELSNLGLSRSSTFKDVYSKSMYQKLQNILHERSRNIYKFKRIYFDLLWNERYKSPGENLFETNPI